jgi:hypothetical protein
LGVPLAQISGRSSAFLLSLFPAETVVGITGNCTLIDSRSLIWESHRIVFSEFRLPPPPPAESLALVGQTLDLILAELAGPTAPIRDMVRDS